MISGAIAALVGIAGCASPGVPPGGPPDTVAPQVVRIAPDSGRTGVTPRDVIFRFDEVVNERPVGAASLAALFLISPRQGTPEVDWNRDEVAVRPQKGWRKNTTYTVTLLPGMSDIRGNVRNTGAVTIFSTGRSIPQTRLTGRLFNWPAGAVAPRAVVEAVSRPDTSLIYVTTTDSLGRFLFPHLPSGPYTVRGFLDENANRGLDQRELWDSVAITLADSASVELLAFVHDSVGPRISEVSIRDSVTLVLNFDGPILVPVAFTAASVTVTAPDSTRLPVVSVRSAAEARDTAFEAPGVIAETTRPSKPVPPRTLIVALGAPLRAGIDYRVRAIDIRSLVGVARSSERTATIPLPPAVSPPPAKPPAPVREIPKQTPVRR